MTRERLPIIGEAVRHASSNSLAAFPERLSSISKAEVFYWMCRQLPISELLPVECSCSSFHHSRPQPVLGSVAVREFSAPGFLTGGPIAYRQSPEQLDFYDYHRRAVDPRHTVTGAVIQQIQSRGVFQSVDLFDGRETPDCLMTGAIDHLEEVDQGSKVTIEVGLSARLINLRTGQVLWQCASSKTAKLDQRSVPGMFAEMCRQVGMLSKA